MDKAAIEAVLPHRDPMLLIDEVLELVPGERVVARKTVTEEDCAGHFPGNPIMPGVKMVEALAQCGAVAVLSQPENRGKLALFAGIDDVRFKRVVRPGEMLMLECHVETVRGPVGRGKVKATVDGQLAVRGTLTFAVGRRVIGAHERPADLDHGPRLPRARARPDERRARDDRRHERRVDRRAHRHPRAPDRGRRRGDDRHRAAGLHGGRSRWPASEPASIDLLIVATVTPDMAFPSSAALLADTLGMPDAAAYDLLGRLHRASSTRSRRPTRCSRRAWPSARSSSAATCSRRSSTGPTARRSCSSATARARS